MGAYRKAGNSRYGAGSQLRDSLLKNEVANLAIDLYRQYQCSDRETIA